MLTPPVPATREAVEAIAEADLILIGPGGFLHQPAADPAARRDGPGAAPHPGADGVYR